MILIWVGFGACSTEIEHVYNPIPQGQAHTLYANQTHVNYTQGNSVPVSEEITTQKAVENNRILSQVVVDQKPFWHRIDVLLFGILFVVFISLGSYGLGMNIRDRRKSDLERQVQERTEELQRANFELTQRNTELDRFVYSASHDISSPLKSILGLINVARMENPTLKQAQYLEMMEKSVEKLEYFIQEVIQYSRNARMPVQFDEFDFQKMVTEIYQSYNYVSGFERIQFIVANRVGELITSDVMRLKIILNNLISNAIKFHRTDTEIEPHVKISISRERDNYIIEVEDNGKGIQSDYVAKIFEMFFRASEDAPGSGLGLYILKETVLRLQGKIDVRSKVNEGTTFTVTIPVQVKR